jgi:peptide/nickel transport system substrate-binding protein
MPGNQQDRSSTPRPGGHPGRRQFLAGLASTAAAGGLLAACGSAPAARPGAVPRKRYGGNLKAGLTGGSSSDTIDPHKALTYLDISRLQMLYSPLVQLDAQASTEYVLAESITPHNSASEWVIRLRPGITFHDGQDLTADDVIYTFRRIISGKFSGANALGPVDASGLKALDKLTVLVPMTSPYGSFTDQLAATWFLLYIVPAGFSPAKPNGTGPFTYQSFTPGQRSVFRRNPHYFKTGLPYGATMTLIDFPDTVSLQDALMTGQIHAAGTLSGPQVATLATTTGIRAVASQTGGITPFTMRTDQPPFNDVNVRQAMRLLVDRPQLIASALDGYGTLGSDVFSPYDPGFDHALRREQDVGQARFLLRKAGQENLSVQLVTSAIATATVAQATVLAEQAKAAGVTISLKTVDPGVLFGPGYLSWTFSQDYYGYNPYLAQVAQSMLPKAPFNETHERDPRYISLYHAANATTDPSRRRQIVTEMQQFDFAQGGYIVPAFIDFLDAYSTRITGYTAAKVGQPLSNFGYENFAFAT